MPDMDEIREADQFDTRVPQKIEGFFLKGSNSLEWGMKDRLARIFSPVSGRTVMLAFDHGYIMGPTSGLERMDLTIVPLIEYADCIMCTRGALRTLVPPTCGKPVSLRYSAGSTVLTELNDECIMDIEEAVRLNASLLAVMVAVGHRFEAITIRNLTRAVDMGTRYGIPTLGVTAVGKEMDRDARYLSMASRVCAENGAHVVKTYFCEQFERVASTCPVPIVLAGGKKLPELDALTMAYQAIDQGASGVDMGRNIFQASDPVAMIQAVRAVVHDHEKPEKAYELYETLKDKG
ncbi:MAG: 3-hydroxy-5-phosphonooxypentane-2,4-dione thiolase [Deltaproteobacteria bacterium]|nr:3-hydroxy-5-phosphonooxypentane-2,4-dione thiolase [Deltaproteobacteria bacterium]MBW2049323.1 3-hydroxy-5-phosphonooxypentane-2,4-dione thiolase [Deltaproteobacteria bacterium]MBW2112430.1 3-hydroxy-5-phosphonooxypentane-2,4-dione thiolase [Deltaproteobacteria bacterium]HDZ90435.1 3-hydroxy-5-phosphonooxypentane-2,4-dione thiolase [Deltaproteobacteria bacterium]